MSRSTILLLVRAAMLFLLVPLPAARAAVTLTGDSSFSAGAGYVGNNSFGTLTVDGGSTLSPGPEYIGYHQNAVGIATVDGAGLTWGSSYSLYVGDSATAP